MTEIKNIGKIEKGINYPSVDIFRLIAGDEISAGSRKISPEDRDSINKTGSIGFMDYYAVENNMFLYNAGIEPKFQRHGFLGQFIKKTKEIAKNKNIYTILVAVDKRNEAMIKAMAKYKFVPCGSADDYNKMYKMSINPTKSAGSSGQSLESKLL